MRYYGIVCAAAFTAIVVAPDAARGQPRAPNDVSGEAFGLLVKKVGNPGVGRTPTATLVRGVRLSKAEHGPFGTPPGLARLTATRMGVSTSGVVGKNAATAQGKSSVTKVDILGGIIKAEHVMAVASSAGNGRKASSNAKGSQILGLVVNGVSMGDVTPAPNTNISIPGVGLVILNEQTATGDGVTTTGLLVNMIHVVLKDPLTGATTDDIIVGSAKSGSSFSR
jgi:hypothetical protein